MCDRLKSIIARLAIATIMGGAAVPAHADTDICAPGATLTYPITQLLTDRAIGLYVLEFTALDIEAQITTDATPAKDAQNKAALRQATLAALKDKPQNEQDALILALLDYRTIGGNPLFSLTAIGNDGLLPDTLNTLERRRLHSHAALIRAAFRAYGSLKLGNNARYQMWLESQNINMWPTLDDTLSLLSEDFLALPDLTNRAAEIIRSDPALLARYTEDVANRSDDDRRAYLMQQVWSCMQSEWWTKQEADDAFGRLPQPQRDLVLLDMMMAEVMNGSVDQLFYNSSGTMIPQMRDILRREGLDTHAQALTDGMAQFGKPYPRDTDLRRDAMVPITDIDENAFYRFTGVFDDGQVYDLMDRIARQSGLWPE